MERQLEKSLSLSHFYLFLISVYFGTVLRTPISIHIGTILVGTRARNRQQKSPPRSRLELSRPGDEKGSASLFRGTTPLPSPIGGALIRMRLRASIGHPYSLIGSLGMTTPERRSAVVLEEIFQPMNPPLSQASPTYSSHSQPFRTSTKYT